jgi:hypothetical protein
MPPHLQQPYTQTLSMLRKIDLIRLSLEFRLPTDGSVVNLRDRLRVYLNAHRETLYRNPRFNPLFPKHRRPPQRPASPVPDPLIPPSRTPSPAGSNYSGSSAHSYESWNGIEHNAHHHLPPAQPPHFPVHHPSPSPSVPGSVPDSPPPSDHPADLRKFFLSLPKHPYPSTYVLIPTPLPPQYCGPFPHIFLHPIPLPYPLGFTSLSLPPTCPWV